MSLEHVILGWLSTGPGSGYDLVRALDFGVHWFWSAPHSQIYPKLKKLEDEGLIVSESAIVGERLEKKIYAITDSGRQEIADWAGRPPTYPPSRDSERIKLIFGDTGDLTALRSHFLAHLDHYRARRESLRAFLAQLTSRQHERIERRIERAPSEAHAELTLTVREMAYRGDIKRAENEMAWAQEALDWLDAFEARWNVSKGHLPLPSDDDSPATDGTREVA